LLLAAGMLLAAGGAAQAQLNPQELLKQVLPGASQDSDDSAASGERACQRYAEKQGLEVRKISDTSRSGSNNLEVLLSVEDRDDRYDARCIYDTKDEEVREFEPVHASTGDQDGEVSERLAQRAQEACEELALDRDLDDVDFDEARARGDETVEIDLRARVRGERQNFTCLYDDDQRHAVLAE
jgi:hypothetical protein